MQLTDNKFIFPRHYLLSDYTNCPEQLIRFFSRRVHPFKDYFNFPRIRKIFFMLLNIPLPIFLLKSLKLSNVIYKSPQKWRSKNGVFLLFFCSKIVLKPLYVVVEPYSFSPEPQYVIRIILSTWDEETVLMSDCPISSREQID